MILPKNKMNQVNICYALLSVGIALITSRILIPNPTFDDFEVYYRAGKEAAAHRTVYNFPGHYQFKYSPFIALIFGKTISNFPLDISGRLYYCILVLTCVLWLTRLIRNKSMKRTALSLPLAFMFMCAYSTAICVELRFGQVNLVPLLCYGVLFSGLHRNRKKLGRKWFFVLGYGLLGSISFQTKLYALIFLPSLIFRKKFGILISILIWTVLLDGVFMATYHSPSFAWSENFGWASSLTQSSRELLLSYYNVSLLGCLEKGTHSKLIASVLWQLLLVIYLLLCFLIRKKSPWRAFEVGCILIPLLTPLSWPYWSFIQAPAFLRLVEKTFRVWDTLSRSEKGSRVTFLGTYVFFTWRQDEPESLRFGLATVELLLLFYYLWATRILTQNRQSFSFQKVKRNFIDGGFTASPLE